MMLETDCKHQKWIYVSLAISSTNEWMIPDDDYLVDAHAGFCTQNPLHKCCTSAHFTVNDQNGVEQ